ncbi:hypothetical protein D9757_006652 [Collybiopsis confluens]|uniref:Uncharacterized protein n=1 Tax=Collybiopsis confluens TaxID=2823264 RepID=A0A8H5HN47_9AGAR|nr:hypothetical protein D9757_006652 [Collybiopsis confluens]
MEASPSAPRNLRNSRGENDTEKEAPLNPKEKANPGGEEKAVKIVRATRYKDKFTTLRDRYEHVMAKQQTYHHDLESANVKMKKLQEEIDLLLEALMPNTPPAPSATLDQPERDMYHHRIHGNGNGMDINSEPTNAGHIPIHLAPRNHTVDPRSKHSLNGKTNGSLVNGTRPYPVESEIELNNHIYHSRESNGRIPIS